MSPIQNTEKSYLGDGVYASYDGFHIVLTAERENRTEYIYLDPYVYDALMKYVERVVKKA